MFRHRLRSDNVPPMIAVRAPEEFRTSVSAEGLSNAFGIEEWVYGRWVAKTLDTIEDAGYTASHVEDEGDANFKVLIKNFHRHINT